MYQRKIPKDYKCGALITADIINGKWKPCILNKINEGIRRPSELLRALPDAARRSLNIQLNELETHGIITKKIYSVLPPKVEYFLTQAGHTLIPITLAMAEWGSFYSKDFLRLSSRNGHMPDEFRKGDLKKSSSL